VTPDEKYTVRKSSDGELLAPGTYFVLRAGDQFAYAALWQYSQVLQLAHEVNPLLSDEEIEKLQRLQTLVEDLAEKWQAVNKKLPD
jgi:hypothetical protein